MQDSNSTATEPTHHSRRTWQRQLGLVLGVVVSLGAIVWVFHFVGSANFLDQIRQIRVEYALLALLLTVVSYVLRAWRWRFFFENNELGFLDSVRCLFVGFFMNNTLPARMGEFVRAHLGGRLSQQSRTKVLATIAGERLADGVTMSGIFALFYYWFSSEKERAEGAGVMYVALAFAIVAVGTVVVISGRELLFRCIDAAISRFSGRASQYTLIRVRTFIDGLAPMFRPKKLVVLTTWSILVWLVELTAYAQVARAFDYPMSLGTLSLFLAAVNFSSLIPSAPGAVGVIEAFATLALVHIGVEKDVALAMVTTQHLIQYIVVGVPGAFFFFHYFKRKVPKQEFDSLTSAS